MKKLMVAACAIAFAAVSQAASFNWNGAIVIEDEIGITGEGNIAFYQGATLLDSIALDEAGKATFDFNLTDDGTGDYGTIKAIATLTNFSGGTETGTKDWSMALTQDIIGTYPDASSASTAITKAAGNTFNTISDFDESAASNGYTAAVPEPTSGLLLLLGVAGLALKRKRA